MIQFFWWKKQCADSQTIVQWCHCCICPLVPGKAPYCKLYSYYVSHMTDARLHEPACRRGRRELAVAHIGSTHHAPWTQSAYHCPIVHHSLPQLRILSCHRMAWQDIQLLQQVSSAVPGCASSLCIVVKCFMMLLQHAEAWHARGVQTMLVSQLGRIRPKVNICVATVSHPFACYFKDTNGLTLWTSMYHSD